MNNTAQEDRRKGWKRSNSDQALDRIIDEKRRKEQERVTRSMDELRAYRLTFDPSQQQPQQQEADSRSILQATLDRISDLQRRLHQTGSDSEETSASEQEEGQEETNSDDSVVLAGYDYCFQEAVKYLVEEEGLTTSDPVLHDLQEHLTHQRHQLDCPRVFREYTSRRELQPRDTVETTGWSCCAPGTAATQTEDGTRLLTREDDSVQSSH